MAFYFEGMGPAVLKWHWEERRVWSPFLRCQRTRKFLFLKKAFYGRYYIDWEFDHDLWLSANEYLFASLKGEFDG